MFSIVRRYFRYFDWISFLITLLLCIIGLLFVFSSTYRTTHPISLFFKKQLFGVLTGFIIYVIFCISDYRSLCRWGYFLYFMVIGLLLFTLLKGKVGLGAQRWIDLFLFRFQPSELAKLFFPAFMTYSFFTIKDRLIFSFANFLPVLTILLVSTFLIVKQPDLGTAILILLSGFILTWLAGMPKKFFIISLLVLFITTPLSWHLLKPYQKNRIAVFLGGGEKHKERYQIEQSKIAIGSGGVIGKGLLKGTQNQFMFLPESRTDFIFSVIGEEWGFLGALLILFLYTILFLRLFYVISTIKDFFTQLLATGLIIHMILSTIINIGMVIGLLPIVGIPLPLLSYGITNLWVTLASLGWFNGISIRRYYIGE